MTSNKRKGRGRPSSIDQLPEDLRVEINAALRDRRLTQTKILDTVNPVLEVRGEKTISKSALGRYAMSMEEKETMMRETRKAADALVGGLGEHKGTDMGRAVTELVKTLSFNLMLNEGKTDVDTLYKVALLSQRIERASKIAFDRESQVRKQALEDAAQNLEQEGKKRGMTAERLKEIRDMLKL